MLNRGWGLLFRASLLHSTSTWGGLSSRTTWRTLLFPDNGPCQNCYSCRFPDVYIDCNSWRVGGPRPWLAGSIFFHTCHLVMLGVLIIFDIFYDATLCLCVIYLMFNVLVLASWYTNLQWFGLHMNKHCFCWNFGIFLHLREFQIQFINYI